MDFFVAQQNSLQPSDSFKFSPVTTVATLSQYQANSFLNEQRDNQEQVYINKSINKNLLFRSFSIEEQSLDLQKRFHSIEMEVMDFFQRKGIKPGHPQQFKKQYNRKLHKRTSLLVDVVQVVEQKAEAGSSLLERRLKKKMTISL